MHVLQCDVVSCYFSLILVLYCWTKEQHRLLQMLQQVMEDDRELTPYM